MDYNEGNNTKQIAENLTSSVSIYCGICTATEYRFGGYRYEWGVSAGSGVIYSLNDGYRVCDYELSRFIQRFRAQRR